MARRKKSGYCRLCGCHDQLTYEHFPPRAAFNSIPVRVKRGRALMTALQSDVGLDAAKDTLLRKGLGWYTLCGRCNNNTGSWYGPAFIDWTFQAARILAASGGAPRLYYPFHVFPLRVLKQVLCIFFSTANGAFGENTEHLRRFVLGRDQRWLPPSVRIYAFYLADGNARSTGLQVVTDVKTCESRVAAEFSFPPMGYILTLDSRAPDERVFDISDFSCYHYNEWCDVNLRLPVLPVYTPFVGDFRNRNQVLREAVQNRMEYLQRRALNDT